MANKNIYKITNEKALINILNERKYLIVATLIGISTDANTKKFKPTYIKYAKNFPRILFLCIMMDKYEDGNFDFRHNLKGFPTIMFFYRSQEISRILGINERKIVSTLEYLELLNERAQEIDLEYQKNLQMVLYKAYLDTTIQIRQQLYMKQLYEQQQKQLAGAESKTISKEVAKKEESEQESDKEEDNKEKTKIDEIVPSSSTKTLIDDKPKKESEHQKETEEDKDEEEIDTDEINKSKGFQTYNFPSQVPLYIFQAQVNQKS
jgi:hypothetical protein